MTSILKVRLTTIAVNKFSSSGISGVLWQTMVQLVSGISTNLNYKMYMD